MKHNNYKTRAGRRARSRLARVLTLLALLLAATGAWAQDDPTYNVRLKAGTKDAANWTITPDEATTTGVPAETAVTLKYGGRMKVKGVTARTYDPLETPLTLEALTARTIMVTTPKVGMKYKKNNGALSTLNSTDDVTIDVQEGDKVEFYGNGTSITSYNGTYIAGGTAEVKVYGNIMSLVNEQNYPTAKELTEQYALCGLFGNNTTLKDASGLLLPATTLADECYGYLFGDCTALTAAPELPATTLAKGCYTSMFKDCTALTAAPKVLPAKTLAAYCCHQMFQGCVKLTKAPELPATTLAPNCYNRMFKDCIELTTSPVLRATMLASSCYAEMFIGCSKLNTVICLATDVSADNCFSCWLYNIPSVGTLYVSADLASDDVPKMLDGSGWAVRVYVAPDD